jgi:hypothetical protein
VVRKAGKNKETFLGDVASFLRQLDIFAAMGTLNVKDHRFRNLSQDLIAVHADLHTSRKRHLESSQRLLADIADISR